MKRRFNARTLLVALGLVTVAFVAATVLVHHLLARMDVAAFDIAENASPSIEHLAAMRGELGQVQTRLDSLLDASMTGESVDPGELDASRRTVHTELAAYFVLPVFPEEQASWAEFRSLSLEFDRAVDRVLSEMSQGNLRAARYVQRHDVDRTAEALASTTGRLIELNARHDHDLARYMVTLRRRAQSIAAVLTVSCVGLAVLAFAFVQHEARRDRALDDEKTRLLTARAEELENFAGRVAHDVLSPLSSVKLSLALIEREHREDATIATHVARADRGLARVASVVHGLLAFASAGAQPEPGASCDASQVAEGVIEDLRFDAERERVALVLETRGHQQVACSQGVLVSLLSNLSRNALKYMGNAEKRRVMIRIDVVGDRAHIEVEDSGPGVPSEQIGRLFEPFYRVPGSTQPGIGLGLATVRRLVDSHGGVVGVRSKVGEGSVFWFDLPCPRREEVSPDASRGSTTPAAESRGGADASDRDASDRGESPRAIANVSRVGKSASARAKAGTGG